jgi:hypothetical protein
MRDSAVDASQATGACAPDRRPPARAAALRAEINSAFLTFLMEAHSGLSAKIVEEVGFPGIWASGLSISASLGLRDSNEASWTQVLEVLEFMAESTALPILVDGDTGYGNFTMQDAWYGSRASDGSPASASRTNCSRRPIRSSASGSRLPTSKNSAGVSRPERTARATKTS